MNDEELSELLTAGEVIALLKISEAVLYRWDQGHVLKMVQINNGGHRRYLKKDVLEFLNFDCSKIVGKLVEL
jgi:DNA-binding transcriptional MerR regulator